MQGWKRNNFDKFCPGKTFPALKPVSAEGVVACREVLLELAACTNEATVKDVFDSLVRRWRKLPVSVEDDSDEFRACVDLCGWELAEAVAINFPRDDGFDLYEEMQLQDLVEFFDDIWYPSTDELVVVSITRRSAIVVTHYGFVGVLPAGADELDLP